jgi:hypothetical protein
MTKSNLRWAIVALGLATGLIHLSLNPSFSSEFLIFTLNGLGYLTLVTLFFFDNPVTRGREMLLHYAFIGFAAATIIAFFALGGEGTLGYVTKGIEVLLIAALWLHKDK